MKRMHPTQTLTDVQTEERNIIASSDIIFDAMQQKIKQRYDIDEINVFDEKK